MLNQSGIAHTFEIYEGSHVNHIPEKRAAAKGHKDV
jgi:hypothetical protein